MQKILVALDSTKINMTTLEFACYLGRIARSKITGLLLENLESDKKPVLRTMYQTTYLDWQPDVKSPAYQEKMKDIENNIARFKEACTNRGVNCDVYRDSGVPSAELIAESRFADLLVIDPDSEYGETSKEHHMEFVRDILKLSECPVIIAPETFDELEELIFCYDGSRSSFYAIKQFEYLLPEFSNKKVTLLEVNKPGDESVPYQDRVRAWFRHHYENLQPEILYGDARDQIFSHLLLKKKAMIVMGAYGRGALSRLFKESTADKLLKTTNLPLFITHP